LKTIGFQGFFHFLPQLKFPANASCRNYAGIILPPVAPPTLL